MAVMVASGLAKPNSSTTRRDPVEEAGDAQPVSGGGIGVRRWGGLGGALEDMTTAAGVADPSALADQLALVMEGVYASVQALGVAGPARRARALATQLLDSA